MQFNIMPRTQEDINRISTQNNLLHFCCCALEQFDVAVSDALPVFSQSPSCIVVTTEQYECVTSCTTVRLVDEQNAIFTVENID